MLRNLFCCTSARLIFAASSVHYRYMHVYPADPWHGRIQEYMIPVWASAVAFLQIVKRSSKGRGTCRKYSLWNLKASSRTSNFWRLNLGHHIVWAGLYFNLLHVFSNGYYSTARINVEVVFYFARDKYTVSYQDLNVRSSYSHCRYEDVCFWNLSRWSLHTVSLFPRTLERDLRYGGPTPLARVNNRWIVGRSEEPHRNSLHQSWRALQVCKQESSVNILKTSHSSINWIYGSIFPIYPLYRFVAPSSTDEIYEEHTTCCFQSESRVVPSARTLTKALSLFLILQLKIIAHLYQNVDFHHSGHIDCDSSF